MKLKAATVEAIVATDKRQEIPDDLCTGLYLVVQPTGKKSWQVRYRHGGVHRRMTLASFPTLSLSAARVRAREVMAAASEGRDPAEDRKTMTKDITEMQPDELAKHIEEAQKILQKKKDDELEKLAADISAAIKKSNFSLEEVLEKLGIVPASGKSSKTASNKKSKQYVNPNNPEEIWMGAGSDGGGQRRARPRRGSEGGEGTQTR